MKIAVIGVGRIGKIHAKNLMQQSGVDTVTLIDVDLRRAFEVAQELRCDTAENVATALQSGLDGVVIATPTAEHVRLIESLVDARVPIFCEKPVGATIEETIRGIRNSASAGVALQVGFQRRFDPGYAAMKRAYQSGQLGRPLLMRGCTLDPAPPPPEYVATSGGIFWDCSIHDLDVIHWISGKRALSVMALGTAVKPDFIRVEDAESAQAIVELEDGTIASVAATRFNSGGYDARLEVHGTSCAAAVGLSDRTPIKSLEEGVTWPAGPAPYRQFTDRFASAYAAEMAEFVAFTQGRAPRCPAEDALEAHRVAYACERSRREHRMVALSEVPGL